MFKKLIAPLYALAIAAGFLPLTATAKDAPVYTGTFSNLALSGYDTVAYFTEQRPVKGDKAFTHTYMGATWQFSSAANREKFVSAPDKYAPQYGGYCAWAVSQGYTASGDPQRWKVVSGKLYLNYDIDVQKKWETDIAGFIAKGNKNWPSVLGN
jgi:YHS domain-containing protein